ncbi:nuclear pore protein 84/107 [Coemansia spiralis]|nr:nuclear pore protein 84/107 [Coemansia spiralis]
MATSTDIATGFAAVVESHSTRQQRIDNSSSDNNASSARLFAQLARQQNSQISDSDLYSFNNQLHKKSEAQFWKSESSTWDLLERLYALRLQALSGAGSEDAMMGDDVDADVRVPKGSSVVATDFTSVQELMSSDNLLSEYVEVRRWLEENAPSFQPVETRKGYLFYTRKSIRERAIRQTSLTPATSSTDTIVTEADPDAPSRQRKELAYEDAEYEASLLRTLYEYVRRGRVGDAMDLCVESDEPWRAASMKGGLFWRDPNLEPENPMPIDSEDGKGAIDMRPPHTAGNINRTLWKQTCAALAHDESNHMYERALYSALSGRLDEVLLVSENWEDHLWAYVNAMVESKIDQGIKDTSTLYTPAQNTILDHIQSKYPPIRDMAHVFASLATHDSATLRQEANQPFHLLQKAIIKNEFAAYIEEYTCKLQNDELSELEFELLRFVVHAALHLKELGFGLPENAVVIALQTYISQLSKDHRELVAVYVTHLPAEEQTEAYAVFLHGINDPINVRMQLLRLAERHGLDASTISKRTTELTLNSYINADRSTEPDTSFVLAEPVETVTSDELEQIRAIEWVTSGAPLYSHALIKICKLVRRFLLSGRTNAATQLFNSLPDDFVQQEWVKGADLIESSKSDRSNEHSVYDASWDIVSHFQEYIHLLSLCDAYAYYSTWAETVCKRPVGTNNKGARLQTQWLEWKENITPTTERAAQMLRNRVLEVDWLGMQPLHINNVDAEDMDTSGDDGQAQYRVQELTRLRELYIPESVFRLHSVLFETRDALPKNLKRSLDLAQLVADESLGIYHQLAKTSPVYPHGRLTAFMGLMRQSAFEILRIQQASQTDKPPLLMDTGLVSGSIA